MSARRIVKDERGMTLIELLIATSAGMIVFFGLTMIVIASMHQSTRVTNRVHATAKARTVVHTLASELHSACVARYLSPVRQNSSSTTLRFVRAYGSAVSPIPVESAISLSGTTLVQTDYPVSSGSSPSWEFGTTASSTRALMNNVSAISGTPMFSYYKYTSGALSAVTGTLTKAQAETVVKVDIALKDSPKGTPVTDSHGAALIQDSAMLRFTPPVYSTTAANLPCE